MAKWKRSEFSPTFKVHKRFVERSVESSSASALMEAILGLMQRMEKPATLAVENQSVTSETPAKFKKDIGLENADG